MPHCSLEFSHIGLPVAAHSQWNEAQTQCTLHLFADHQHILTFLFFPGLPVAEAQNLARLMMHSASAGNANALPAEMGEEGICRIEGVAALSLTNFLVHLRTHVQEIIRIAEAPSLMGFWEPPPWRAPSEGMILWFHPDEEYHCVIARAKDQAKDAIRRLWWLDRQRGESLYAKINKWNALRISPHAAQEIKGRCAQVLCQASAAAKVKAALTREQARLRPKHEILN